MKKLLLAIILTSVCFGGGRDRYSGPVKTGGEAAFVVAASDSPTRQRTRADYVCDGTADNVQIQAAINALPAGGGKIHLCGGTYSLSATVEREIDNVSISGAGQSTSVSYDGSTPNIRVKWQDGWQIRDIAFDAGGVNPGFSEQVNISNVTFGGEIIGNREVSGMDYTTALASVDIDGTHDVEIAKIDGVVYAFYTSYWSDKLVIYSLADPTSPTLVVDAGWSDIGGTDTDLLEGAHDIAIDAVNKIAYVCCSDADSIVAIDISTIATPALLGSITNATTLASMHAIAISTDGKYLYGGTLSGTYFHTFDVSDPTSISIADTIVDSDVDGCRGVAPHGDYVFVVGKDSGMIVAIDVSDPTDISIADSLELVTGEATNLANVRYKDGYCYATGVDSDEVFVVNVKDPTNISLAATLTGIDEPYYIALSGDYAFVSQFTPKKVAVVDISEPSLPKIVDALFNSSMEKVSGIDTYGDYLITSNRGVETDSAAYHSTVLKINKTRESTTDPGYRHKVITATFDLATATGDVSYSCGFTPNYIEAVASVPGAAVFSHGIADASLGVCIRSGGSQYGYSSTYLIWQQPASGNNNAARVKTLDKDGFTLTWTKTSSPTGTSRIIFNCYYIP